MTFPAFPAYRGSAAYLAEGAIFVPGGPCFLPFFEIRHDNIQDP